MTRYLVFAWNNFEAQVGVGDCTGQTSSFIEARIQADRDEEFGFDNVVIYDLKKKKELWTLRYQEELEALLDMYEPLV